ncbi:MAG: histidine kinase [Bacteroidales bacterium]|nr:histidine kinase [Bacteroidales bacterium]
MNIGKIIHKVKSKGVTTLRRAELLIILVIWMIAFLSPALTVDDVDNAFFIELKHTFWNLLPFFLLFVINHFLLIPQMMFKGKFLYFGLSNILLVSIIIFLMPYFHPEPKMGEQPPFEKHLQDEMPISEAGRTHQNNASDKNAKHLERWHPKHGRPPFRTASFFLSILVIGCDCGVRLGFRYVKIQHLTAQREKQYSENKLMFLKQQVSPHFFMNTLNNIHALIDIDEELAKEAVIRLSKLMRYMLYDCEKGFSPLGKEIEFIQSFVSLMKLRYSDKVKINIDIASNLPNDKQIPSLIFISLIENAFKHGVSYKQDSFIDIRLMTPDNGGHLNFTCDNSLVEETKPMEKTAKKEGGIGVKNTINQLDLIYNKNYELNINKTDKTFSVKLTIPL